MVLVVVIAMVVGIVVTVVIAVVSRLVRPRVKDICPRAVDNILEWVAMGQ